MFLQLGVLSAHSFSPTEQLSPRKTKPGKPDNLNNIYQHKKEQKNNRQKNQFCRKNEQKNGKFRLHLS